MNQVLDNIVESIVREIRQKLMVEVEASGRHVHLSREDVDILFGKGYELTPTKDLSQPGQYACKERISVTGPKGTIKNIIILGPVRKETQIEVSLTDALTLGIKPPVRQSGDIADSPGAILTNGDISIEKQKGVIAAKRHMHLSTADARHFGVSDGDLIKIKVFGSRPLIFEDTVARVSDHFSTYVHIDYDEANACGFHKGTFCMIVK